MRSRSVAIAVAAGVAIGLCAGAILRNAPSPQQPPGAAPTAAAPADTAVQLSALRDQIAAERETLVAIAAEIDQLWEVYGELHANVSRAHPPPAAGPADGDPAGGAADPAAAAPGGAAAGRAGGRAARPEGGEWIDVDALVAAGIPRADAARMRELYEANQLEELYLRDQAAREGWIATGRFRQEVKGLRDQLRTDLGDEDYDWVLWASGRRNRVEIDDVLQNSAAEAAGLHRGDVIVRYDGELMLSPSDLRRATLRGRIGDTIAIDALRDGERVRFYVPAGPLGTRLGATAQRPGS